MVQARHRPNLRIDGRIPIFGRDFSLFSGFSRAGLFCRTGGWSGPDIFVKQPLRTPETRRSGARVTKTECPMTDVRKATQHQRLRAALRENLKRRKAQARMLAGMTAPQPETVENMAHEGNSEAAGDLADGTRRVDPPPLGEG
jgi:hypothetical protein